MVLEILILNRKERGLWAQVPGMVEIMLACFTDSLTHSLMKPRLAFNSIWNSQWPWTSEPSVSASLPKYYDYVHTATPHFVLLFIYLFNAVLKVEPNFTQARLALCPPPSPPQPQLQSRLLFWRHQLLIWLVMKMMSVYPDPVFSSVLTKKVVCCMGHEELALWLMGL